MSLIKCCYTPVYGCPISFKLKTRAKLHISRHLYWMSFLPKFGISPTLAASLQNFWPPQCLDGIHQARRSTNDLCESNHSGRSISWKISATQKYNNLKAKRHPKIDETGYLHLSPEHLLTINHLYVWKQLPKYWLYLYCWSLDIFDSDRSRKPLQNRAHMR